MKQFEIEDKITIYYLDEYTPFSSGNEQNEFDRHIMNVKDSVVHSENDRWKENKKKESIEFFKEKFQNSWKFKNSSDTILCVVPSSKKEQFNENMIEIGKSICIKYDIPTTGLKILTRYCDVPSAHNNNLGWKERNNINRHKDSIKIKDLEFISNKHVILLDDVVTSGGTLKSCREILLCSGAKNVCCLALGKTK